MTANKRFKNVEENLEWGTIQYFTYHDEKITDKEIEKLVNHLLNENEQLKKENNELELLVQNWEALDEEKDEQLGRQNQALKKLKKENLDLSEELDYHKTKCASLETGLFQANKENGRLKKEIKAKDNIVELYYEMVKK